MLANRLKGVLPLLIDSQQSAFVKGRDIIDNVRLIEEILLYTDENTLPGILLTIDFEKAFDCVEWDYMMKCLSTYNFGTNFQKWISTFYTDLKSCVMTNGYSTGYFPITRGVRKGDPLSPYLFILALEIFLINMNSNKSIKGIKIDTLEVKYAAFADDLSCFASDEQSVKYIFAMLRDFHLVSGLQINKEKTEALWLGNWKKREKKPFRIKWPQQPIKITGVFISYNTDLNTTLNFANPLKQIQNNLKIWKSRSLTLIGKIVILKTFVLSQINYVLRMVSTTNDILHKVEQIVFDFLWKGKDKIARKVMVREISEGGMNAPDIKITHKMMRINFIKRYLNDDVIHPWKTFFDHRLSNFWGQVPI